jgi:hypothetical protein
LNRIKNSTFWNWKKKYTEEVSIKVTQFAQIIPVQLNATAPLEIRNGSFSVIIRDTCDEQNLLAVLKAVKHANADQGADSKCC